MPKIFHPTSEKLRDLLSDIDRGVTALPDFQRDFVWEPRATEELIESICQNYPAGSLLSIDNKNGFFFAPREFEGSPPLNKKQPHKLILDGQQRLTSLYQAFYGTGRHLYFIHIQKLLEGMDLEDSVFYERESRANRRYGTIEKQAKLLIYPLKNIFGKNIEFEEWLDEVLTHRTDDQKDELKKSIRGIRNKWIKNIEDYEFPMVTLGENTSAEAVCTIFETLNRTGVRLSPFDLLAARFWPENVRLRDKWDKACSDNSIIQEFEVDPYYMLQAISIYTAKSQPSCKRSDVLKLEVDQINRGWDSIVEGLTDFLQMLRSDCGILLPRWLPYNTILIPGAAILASVKSKKGPEIGSIRSKIVRWFWCSVFAQTYDNAPNSQTSKDYQELKRWINGEAPPQTVREFEFESESLQETTPRQRAIYRGAIALIIRHGAKDFHTCQKIDSKIVIDKKIDDHHLFPIAFLNNQYTSNLKNCILNRSLIDKETNQRIGKQAPSTYMNEIKENLDERDFKNVLQSHLIPESNDSPVWKDNFEEFIALREKQLYQQIIEVTS